MCAMMTCLPIEHAAAIEQLRKDYLRTLIAPMDGMWERALIAQARFWELRDHEQHAGHFCLGADQDLLRFHLVDPYRAQAQELFCWMVSTFGIQQAITSTIEPLYCSLCLAQQRSSTLHSYLFRDHQRMARSSDPGTSRFRKADKAELADLVRFYQANTEGSGAWIEAFLDERLKRGEVFVLSDGSTVVATGECIPSQDQPPYADLGMVVAQAYRGRGLGSCMLIQLKNHAYAAGWKPICSCAASNRASKKAIERAGFISEHNMIQVYFARDVRSPVPPGSVQES